jgi:hypothetical protein
MAQVQPTEITELDVEKVSGVESPASGTEFLILKATAEQDTEDCPTCKGKGTILQGNRKCPDCTDGKVAKQAETAEPDDAAKALSAADRDKMPASSFAYVDAAGGKHLPVHDKGHVQAAMGRLGQQDFSGAKGSAADAKAKAARKIKAAAKTHGIDVDEDSDVAQTASKGAVQDALGGTATPERAGYDPSTGRSGVAGPVTTGARQLPEPRTAGGGKSTYTIPAEDKQDLTKTAGPAVAFAFSSLAGAIEKLAELRELEQRASKAGMTLTAPSPDESAQPGNMPWESYDSATLAQVAHTLASCDSAISAIIARERAEANDVDPGDYENAWDLGDAQSALDCALGIVARLSFTEAAEADHAGAEKAGRRLSGKTESTLRAARDHLTSVIGDGDKNTKADKGQDSKEEDDIMSSVTKEELAEVFASALKPLTEAIAKNANNGGDISEGDLHDNGTVNDDLALPGTSTTRPGVTKQAAPAEQGTQEAAQTDTQTMQDVTKQLKDLTEYVGKVGGLVAKMAKAPRGGGPILTGQLPAGLQAAGEGRQDGALTKSEGQQEIERLEKQLDEARDPMARQHLSMTLTQRKLAEFHRTAGV